MVKTDLDQSRHSRGAADSSAAVSADLLCEAFAAAITVDSSLAEKIKADVGRDIGRTRERTGAEIAVAAEEDAKARERMYAASRIMGLAASSLTYPLIESESGNTMRLAMTEAERRALLQQMEAIYPATGPRRKPAEHVLEQSIDIVRKFLLEDWPVRSGK